MLDLALVNVNILYNHAAQKPMKHLDFRLEIIRSLLEGYVARTDCRHFSSTSELPLRLSERPFPKPIPSHSKYGGRHSCEVCRARGQSKQTQYRCKICKVPRHLYPCMAHELSHTVITSAMYSINLFYKILGIHNVPPQ